MTFDEALGEVKTAAKRHRCLRCGAPLPVKIVSVAMDGTPRTWTSGHDAARCQDCRLMRPIELRFSEEIGGTGTPTTADGALLAGRFLALLEAAVEACNAVAMPKPKADA